MLNLTFGEQVKIVLSRKGMTIKELAERIEKETGKKMSRQNLTQRLGRDNFQEQDMRMIAEILGCSFQLSILNSAEAVEKASMIEEEVPTEKELNKLAAKKEMKQAKALEKAVSKPKEKDKIKDFIPIKKWHDEEEDLEKGDVNPYTGHESKSNSVRMHPKRIGYVQVYDRKDHKWTDMTEWAFLGEQEQRKATLGKDYEPPIYLD